MAVFQEELIENFLDEFFGEIPKEISEGNLLKEKEKFELLKKSS